MVHWTDSQIKAINKIWTKVNAKEIGGEALARLLSVYPWTQRYFSTFGNLGSCDAISHNAKVISHGEKVVTSIGEAIKHIDDIKGYFAQLSQYHYEKLHVDPANFSRFGSVLIIVLARHFGEEFTPETQAAFNKLFHVVADALGKGYH
ncbi:beta-globin A subunit [Pelobates cultripes]|uniref:Beta-globin A subunit n=1 Tax=Pelobates cultripes TaxID=61616 RepID=A0AAD1WDL0_PELCU|nr:beta-globin A subunit [Pelobates cultripes]